MDLIKQRGVKEELHTHFGLSFEILLFARQEDRTDLIESLSLAHFDFSDIPC